MYVTHEVGIAVEWLTLQTSVEVAMIKEVSIPLTDVIALGPIAPAYGAQSASPAITANGNSDCCDASQRGHGGIGSTAYGA